jgi:hypothetical protein
LTHSGGSKTLARILGWALFLYVVCLFGHTEALERQEPPAPPQQIATLVGGTEPVRRYKHPLGVTFTISSSWRVEPVTAARLSLIPPDKGAVEGIFVLSTAIRGIASAADPNFAVFLDNELRGLGEAFSFLKRQGEPEPIDTRCGPGVLLIWEGISSDGVRFQSRMYAVIFKGRALVIFALGPSDRTQPRDTVLRSSFISFAADQGAMAADQDATAGGNDGSPLVQEWMRRLNGMKLSQMSSYSSGGGGGGMSSQSDLYLNTDGGFVYRSSSLVSMDVAGASGSSGGRSESAGRWSIITDGTRVYLELRFNGAATQRRVLTREDGTYPCPCTYLNGPRTFVLPQK